MNTSLLTPSETMELIYNQHDIPRNCLRYGLRSSASAGCGWIATYNALALMHYHVDPEKLIHYYEMQLPLIHGNFGTSVWGPAVYFSQWDFPVKTVLRQEHFDEAAREGDVSILFYRWHSGCRLGAHFIAVSCNDRGFTGYNLYSNSKGPDYLGNSLSDFLNRRKYFGAVLFVIRDKKHKKPQNGKTDSRL